MTTQPEVCPVCQQPYLYKEQRYGKQWYVHKDGIEGASGQPARIICVASEQENKP